MAQIFRKEGTIYLECHYEDRWKAKMVPCHKWNPVLRMWTYPDTVHTVRGVSEIFGEEIFNSDHGRLMLKEVADHDLHQSVKMSEELAEPPSLTTSWNHQKQAYHFTFPLPSAGIFMEMGTGKTKVAVDLMINRGHRRVLIVCPKRVINVWGREIPKHAREVPSLVLLGAGSTKGRAAVLRRQGEYTPVAPENIVCVVVNYDAVWREPLATEIEKFGFDLVIADEIHRIKSPNGKASKFMAKLGKKIPHRLGLTGTPMPHSPADVYAQYRFLEPSIFGTNYSKFLDRYAVMGGYEGRQIIAFKNREELNEKIYSIAFRVKSNDVLDLPVPIYETVEFELNPRSLRIYRQLLKEAVAEYEDKQLVTDNVLTQFLRLQQITSGYLPGPEGTDVLNTDKATVFKDLLSDIDTHESVLVFYKYHFDALACKNVAESLGREYFEVSGSRNDLEEWKAAEGGVMGVQIQAGGEGEDFTKARYTIYYSLTFSLKDYEQSRFRTLRPGQTRQPIYYHLLAENTIDSYIMDSLQNKKDVVASVLDILST